MGDSFPEINITIKILVETHTQMSTHTKVKIASVALSIATVLSLSGPVAYAATAAELQAQINTLLATIQSLQAQLSQISTPAAAACSFTRALTVGSKGDDVKRLQALLGIEQAGIFGPATEKALRAFQIKHGIVKSERSAGAGKLGPATRAKLTQMYKSAAPAAVESGPEASDRTVSSVSTAPDIQRLLKVGSKGNDVKKLQAFLGVDVTGYFGPATRKAVESYQEKNGISGRGEPGYGNVGPKTRAMMRSGSVSESTVIGSPSVPAQSTSVDIQLDTALRRLKELQEELKNVH